jgi:hypothetical protein
VASERLKFFTTKKLRLDTYHDGSARYIKEGRRSRFVEDGEVPLEEVIIFFRVCQLMVEGSSGSHESAAIVIIIVVVIVVWKRTAGGGENIAGDQLARRDWRLGCSPVFRTDRFGVESKHGQFWGRLARIVL